MTKKISLLEVQYLAHRLATDWMEWNEPIPEFDTRFPYKLESCLETPFQTYAKKDLYRGLESKAAILFYLMIKNHPFHNGNKRIAVTTLFCFLRKNKKWIEVSAQELYNFSIWVASSPAMAKDQTVDAIREFLKKYLVDEGI